MDPTEAPTVTDAHPDRLPRHVAIIMDGNGRWAKRRGQPRHAGHRAGVESVRHVVEFCTDKAVEVLTLFAFSSENWRRPKPEVKLLMELFMLVLKRETRRLDSNNVRLRVIGDRLAFSDKLQQRIHDAEALTAGNSGMVLQIAANYGGRWDIAEATRRIAAKVAAGELDPARCDEQTVAEHLSFADLPDVDLFIRTGGEQRLSNFVLWQAAYAELYFSDLLWPDFDARALEAAFADFAARERRFGKITEQLAEPGENRDLLE
ncbi:MAG TPA: isoprenyl transferase [Chromatiaceae bacterium]|nr:isoprenyl transferase [Chromatiaceae bacterium]